MFQSIQAEFKENKLLKVLECVMGNNVLKSREAEEEAKPRFCTILYGLYYYPKGLLEDS